MIGKLIKYEFRATWKVMCALLVCVTAIFGLIHAAVNVNTEAMELVTVNGVAMFVNAAWFWSLAVSIFLVIAVVTIIVFYGVGRFKKVLTAEEGYLINTLPVKTGSVILSKCFTIAVLGIPVVGVGVIGIIGLFITGGEDMFINIAGYSPGNIQIDVVGLLVQIVTSLIGTMVTFLQIYTAMAIGFSFNKHKNLWSVVIFFVGAFLMNGVNDLLTYVNKLIVWNTPLASAGLISHAATIVFNLVLGFVFFMITRYFMKNRLNLD